MMVIYAVIVMTVTMTAVIVTVSMIVTMSMIVVVVAMSMMAVIIVAAAAAKMIGAIVRVAVTAGVSLLRLPGAAKRMQVRVLDDLDGEGGNNGAELFGDVGEHELLVGVASYAHIHSARHFTKIQLPKVGALQLEHAVQRARLPQASIQLIQHVRRRRLQQDQSGVRRQRPHAPEYRH